MANCFYLGDNVGSSPAPLLGTPYYLEVVKSGYDLEVAKSKVGCTYIKEFNMANWKYTVDLRSIWNDEQMAISDKGKVVATILRQVFPDEWLDDMNKAFDEDLDDLVNAFDNITGYDEVSPVEEFDGWMDDLYDYGNCLVAPFGRWPHHKMARIKTEF